jgi:hypothetical protein
VFHCFTETAEVARAALDLGFYISFSGILTFKKAQDLRDVAAFVPLDRMLIETDSPYLAPVPYRGKTNNPVVRALCGAADRRAAKRARGGRRQGDERQLRQLVQGRQIMKNYFKKSIISLSLLHLLRRMQARSMTFSGPCAATTPAACAPCCKRGFDPNTLDEHGQTGLLIALARAVAQGHPGADRSPQTNVDLANPRTKRR